MSTDTATPQLPDDVRTFLDSLDDARRLGSNVLIAAMHAVTDMPPAMLSGNIIGFGTYRYRYASGREGETCALGFSPRAREFSLYLSCYLDGDFAERQDLLEPLGRARVGKGCLYLKDPAAVAPEALANILRASLLSLARADVVTSISLGPAAQETAKL